MTTTRKFRRSCLASLLFSIAGILAVLVFTVPTFAVDLELRSDFLDDGSLRVGVDQEVEFDVVIVNERPDFDSSIQAYQIAVSHVGTDLEFVEVTWEGTALDTPTLRQGQGPAHFLASEVNDATGEGLTLGVVFDDDVINGFLLGQGTHVVAKLRYRGLASSPGNPSPIGFAASLGDPAIANKLNTFGGSIVEPTLDDPVSVVVAGGVVYSVHFGGDGLIMAEQEDLITLPIRVANNPLDITGFSFGVRYDSALLSREAALTPGPALAPILDGAALEDFGFYAFNEVTDTGGALFGFTVGMIFSDAASQGTDDPVKALPASEEGHHVLDLQFRVTAGTGTLSNVSIVGDLGDPAVDVVLDINGVSQRPEGVTPGHTSVAVQVGDNPGVRFLRADVDQDSRVNLTDALNIIKFQFTPEDVPAIVRDTGANCFGAFDVNGDNSVAVSDTLNLLNFLFLTGARPAAPYSSCGFPEITPTAELFCRSFSCP